jgi:hypothetical protein
MPPPEWPFWRHEDEPIQPAKRVDSTAVHHEETLAANFRKLVSLSRQSIVARLVALGWRGRE